MGSKCWTVVAKKNCAAHIPQGFTVTNVIVPQGDHNYAILKKRVKEMVPNVGDGFWSDNYWDWR